MSINMEQARAFQKSFLERHLGFFYGDIERTARHIGVPPRWLAARVHELSIDVAEMKAQQKRAIAALKKET